MSRLALLSCAALVVACSKGEQASSEGTIAAAGTIALADVAGTWEVRTMAMGSDSVIVTSKLVATGTNEGWMLTLPGRDPAPMRVILVSGDSIVTETGPYESVLRPGVMVTTRQVNRLQGGKLIGTVVARYQTTGADSVVNLRSEGTRAQ